MPVVVPEAVLRRATGASEVLDAEAEPVSPSSGATTDEVVRIVGTVRAGRHDREFSLIRKSVRSVATGRHAGAAQRPDHWAYWEREALAYKSGLLPTGPGLRSPRWWGTQDNVIYLEDVGSQSQSVDRAAADLRRWHGGAGIDMAQPDWLAGHQLAQRVAVTELDWTSVDVDRRAARLWDARSLLLDDIDRLPRVLCHGDFNLGNVVASNGDTVAFDWGAFGLAPAGADLAHLALGTLTDPLPAYFAASSFGPARDEVVPAFRTTLVLTGVSRMHWMLSRGEAVPRGYFDFVWSHRPASFR